MIVIFSYERQQMLTNLLNELDGYQPIVIDDGSSFKFPSFKFHQFKHGGKENFYKLWQYALLLAYKSEDDFYMFLPSDFQMLDLDKIFSIYNDLKHEPFVCNIINDGRTTCWNSYKPIPLDNGLNQVFFTDCGFFCNRLALEKIEFTINDIPKTRFNRSDISSGVGQQLTYLFNKNKVKMYTPLESLAFHGEHESLMHPNERLKNPLISK